jgi:hypothetical protein
MGDETLSIKTSSIHNSLKKCPIRECQTILESPYPALKRTNNRMVEKMNPEKSDLTVKPKRHTYISPSTYFFRHSDDTVGFARIENGEVGPVKI